MMNDCCRAGLRMRCFTVIIVKKKLSSSQLYYDSFFQYKFEFLCTGAKHNRNNNDKYAWLMIFILHVLCWFLSVDFMGVQGLSPVQD